MPAPFPMSHVLWHFPYVFAAPPYGRTPDEFPHTFWQIPTGRPFSHSHVRSPIDRPFPHTIHKLQKSGFHFDETSVSSPTNPQPIPSSRHPEPALQSSKPIPNRFQQITRVTIQQTKRRPVPANATDLRLGVAPAPPARVCARFYGHGHAYIFITHAHAFKGTRTVTHAHVKVRAHF